jgi:hypothetical protein
MAAFVPVAMAALQAYKAYKDSKSSTNGAAKNMPRTPPVANIPSGTGGGQ